MATRSSPLSPSVTDGTVAIQRAGVPYGTTPDCRMTFADRSAGCRAADMNGDQLVDVVVGCYISQSYPPYEVWRNYIYYNIGGQLEGQPLMDLRGRGIDGDVQVALINDDPYPTSSLPTAATKWRRP